MGLPEPTPDVRGAPAFAAPAGVSPPTPVTDAPLPAGSRGLFAGVMVVAATVLAWVPDLWPWSFLACAGLSLLFFAGVLIPGLAGRIPRSLSLVGVAAAGWPIGLGIPPSRWWILVCLLPLLAALEIRHRGKGWGRAGAGPWPRLWLLFGLAGAALAVEKIAEGLAEHARWNEANLAKIAVALGLVLASPGVVGWGRYLTCRPRTRSGRLAVAAAASAALVATSIAAGWILVEPSPAPRTPMGVAHELRERLRTIYPRWETAPSSLDDLWSAYLPRLRGTAETCAGDDDRTCLPLVRALRDLFAELDNGHTFIAIPEDLGLPPVNTRQLQDGIAVTWVDSEFESPGCDVARGSEILAVDGREVRAAARNVPDWLVAGSRLPEHEAIEVLLWGDPGSDVSITVANAADAPCTVTMTRESAAESWREQNADGYEDPVEASRLTSSIGYLDPWGFGGDTIRERLLEAVDDVMDTRGLVVDLRGNPGGQASAAEEFAGRFLAGSVDLGEVCRWWCIRGVCADRCGPRTIDPVEPRYPGPVAVLIDQNVASAAEAVAYTLCEFAGARCFGRTTAGSTDYVMRWDYPWGMARISSARFHVAGGPEVQGNGVRPHESVPLRLSDLRQDRDPVLDAARRWLETEMKNSPPSSSWCP